MSQKTVVRVVAVVSGLALAFASGCILDKPTVVTGTAVEFHAGDWLSISNDQVEPFPLVLRERRGTKIKSRIA
jgi:hypothetical protein